MMNVFEEAVGFNAEATNKYTVLIAGHCLLFFGISSATALCPLDPLQYTVLRNAACVPVRHNISPEAN